MLALTLYPEWPVFIFWPHHNAKRIENRIWPCPGYIIGQTIAIHSGARIAGVATVDEIRRQAPRGERALEVSLGVTGAVATARAAGLPVPNIFAVSEFLDRMHPSHIIGTATVVSQDQKMVTEWDVEWGRNKHGELVRQWHWRLDDVRPLASPIPCKGAQGLWSLPEDVEAGVRAQLAQP